MIGIGGSAAGPKSRSQLIDIALGSLVLVSIAFPGYIAAVALIDIAGPFRLQAYGFAALAVLFLVLASSFIALKKAHAVAVAVVIYALTFFATDAGPNVTTFVFPVQVFPESVRATAHGLSAAFGKAGAIVGVFSLPHLLHSRGDTPEAIDTGLSLVLYLCSGLSAAGLLVTLLFLHRGRFAGLDRCLRSIGRAVCGGCCECCRVGAACGGGAGKDKDKDSGEGTEGGEGLGVDAADDAASAAPSASKADDAAAAGASAPSAHDGRSGGGGDGDSHVDGHSRAERVGLLAAARGAAPTSH